MDTESATKSTPDMHLICTIMVDYTDIISIELKKTSHEISPEVLWSPEQKFYLKSLEQLHVQTLVGNHFEVIKLIDDHYRQLAQRQLKRFRSTSQRMINPSHGLGWSAGRHIYYIPADTETLRRIHWANFTNNTLTIELINYDCSRNWWLCHEGHTRYFEIAPWY